MVFPAEDSFYLELWGLLVNAGALEGLWWLLFPLLLAAHIAPASLACCYLLLVAGLLAAS